MFINVFYVTMHVREKMDKSDGVKRYIYIVNGSPGVAKRALLSVSAEKNGSNVLGL